MSGGDIAGLVAAGALLIFVLAFAVPLMKLGRVLDETSNVIKAVGGKTMPLMDEVTTTVTLTNTQLERVDAITRNVQSTTESISGLTQSFTDTLSGPLMKAAAFSLGLRKNSRERGRGNQENSRRRTRRHHSE